MKDTSEARAQISRPESSDLQVQISPAAEKAIKRELKWADIVIAVTALLALGISVVTAVIATREQEDSSESGVIKDQYSMFLDLNKQQRDDWQLSHMYELPENYEATRMLVATSISSNTPEEKRVELMLRERAIALQIFTLYEQALVQHDQAVASGDNRRRSFLEAVVKYFSGRLLQNPRLRYYWNDKGGGMQLYFGESTKNHYSVNVSRKDTPVGEDTTGPYVQRK
jgi:hypothetical protein